jgi:hypothetical protein
MTHEDVSVAEFRESPKLFRDFVDRSRDESLCRKTAIALARSVKGVRRDKAALSSGCKAHPAFRSSRKRSEQSWR